jgi:hypothetical protein
MAPAATGLADLDVPGLLAFLDPEVTILDMKSPHVARLATCGAFALAPRL